MLQQKPLDAKLQSIQQHGLIIAVRPYTNTLDLKMRACHLGDTITIGSTVQSIIRGPRLHAILQGRQSQPW